MKCTRISVKKTTVGFGLLLMASTTLRHRGKPAPERSRCLSVVEGALLKKQTNV
jgi:hypothetical protein